MSTLILNSGRLVTYSLLGAAFGALGMGIQLAGIQQGVSIIAGLVLLLSVIIPGSFGRWSPTGRVSLAIARLRGMLGRNLKRTELQALFITGVLNGLLPCGLVYAAAIGAAALGTAQHGAFFMALFGLGTWPALITLRVGGGMVGPHARMLLRRASPVLVSVVAVLMILRGLELNIPLVSPPSLTVPAQVNACH